MALRKLAGLTLLSFALWGCSSEDILDLKRVVSVRFVGTNQCQAWRPGERMSPDDTVKLNWVLGFLSGMAVADKEHFLDGVSNEEIWAMVVAGCAAQPDNNLGTVAFGIRRELRNRHR